jgi:hypothetical protein
LESAKVDQLYRDNSGRAGSDFSPIENCWSKVKEFLRSALRSSASLSQAARTYQQLDEAITNALNAVTKKDIIGWFTHCCYYIAPN